MSKKIIFLLITVLLVCGLIEVFCLGAWHLAGCDNSTRTSACQNPKADLNIVLPPWMTNNVGQFIIHPYLGFVYNPDNSDITKYGFLDTKSPVQKKTADKIIVGIFGGSSAEIFGQFGAETLKNDLLEDPRFKHKEIVVLNLAIGSYKQPQQLMALNYLLAIGSEFDYVINLDGFNELVLPVLRNLPSQVNPFFPRRWDLKVVDSLRLEPQIVILADILKLKQKNLRQANLAHCGILRFSATARLLSYCWARNLNSKITVKMMELFDLQSQKSQDALSVVGHGPEFNYADQADLYAQLSGLWARASKQMEAVCSANNIEYFHFIQPCQYVPDSKNMDAEESKTAFDPDVLHRQIVINGYPVLRQQAEWLKQQGITVNDLSMVFKDYSQPLYIDTFCHFGQEGSQIIAHAIAQTIIAKHKKQE